MKGKLKKIDNKWFVEYSEWITKGGKKGVLGGYTRSINRKTLPLLMDSTTFPKDRSNFVVGSRVKFTEVFINPMGREVNPYDLGQNHSGCVWYAKIVEDKQEQKQHLIDMMKGDEELGLYDDILTLKLTKEDARGLLTCIMRTSAKGKDLDVGEMVEEQLVQFLKLK
jgi:hypothetical protein